MIVLYMILIGFPTLVLSGWLAHLAMMYGEDIEYGYSNFRKYKYYFDKIEWFALTDTKYYLESEDKKDVFSFPANIFKFNGKGMIINNPISWLLVVIYSLTFIKRNYTYPKKTRNTVNW